MSNCSIWLFSDRLTIQINSFSHFNLFNGYRLYRFDSATNWIPKSTIPPSICNTYINWLQIKICTVNVFWVFTFQTYRCLKSEQVSGYPIFISQKCLKSELKVQFSHTYWPKMCLKTKQLLSSDFRHLLYEPRILSLKFCFILRKKMLNLQ